MLVFSLPVLSGRQPKRGGEEVSPPPEPPPHYSWDRGGGDGRPSSGSPSLQLRTVPPCDRSASCTRSSEAARSVSPRRCGRTGEKQRTWTCDFTGGGGGGGDRRGNGPPHHAPPPKTPPGGHMGRSPRTIKPPAGLRGGGGGGGGYI